MRCQRCGGSLDLTLPACPACGAEVELGRLTGILGVVCRACDAYNEPGATVCAGCGKPLGGSESAVPAETAAPPVPPPPASSGKAGEPSVAPPPPPGAPVVRSFARPAPGAATRVVPSVLRRPASQAPEPPSHTPVPLATACPRCGAPAASGRFCARCGEPLGARGTPVVSRPPAAAAPAAGPKALAPGRARLVLESGRGGPEASWPLDAEAVAAGRSRGAVLFPDDPTLAPHHATFLFRGGALLVRDEGGPGGLFLRLRGASVPLRPGDDFAIGDRLLRYVGPLPPAPPPPADGTRRLGSPRPAAPAVLVEERLEGGASGRVFVRAGPALTIGRAGCAVNLGEHPQVAQAHAELLLEPGGAARLKDLGSPGGTYLRLPPHGERELHDGDRVRLGRAVLRISTTT